MGAGAHPEFFNGFFFGGGDWSLGYTKIIFDIKHSYKYHATNILVT